MLNAPKLLSSKSVAEILDCSLSEIYREVKAETFPAPDVKLFGDSNRGYRWFPETITAFINSKRIKLRLVDDDAPPFIPIDPEKIIREGQKRRVA